MGRLALVAAAVAAHAGAVELTKEDPACTSASTAALVRLGASCREVLARSTNTGGP